MAQEGAVSELADRPLQGGRDPADHDLRDDLRRVPRLQPLVLVHEEPVRGEQQAVVDLHGLDVRAGHRDLRRRARGPEEPGDRPVQRVPGDPGRMRDRRRAA